MKETHVIISDLQIPYHDVNLFSGFLSDTIGTDPTSVTIIGDFMDFPGPSTWSKGTIKEYTDNLSEQIEQGKKYLGYIRRQFDCPIYFHMGNHENRIASYIRKYAPALGSLAELNVPQLLDFHGNGIILAGDYRTLCPGVITTHGHLGRFSKVAGMTALNAAIELNVSVVCGHTHRLGVVYRTNGNPSIGTQQSVFGMEVGHMMDVNSVSYVKSGVLNWQSGYGIVTYDSESGIAQPTPIRLER